MPEDSEKWLRVIGIGEDGWEDLGAEAKSLLYESKVILGGVRHLKMLPDDLKGERILWTSPMRESVQFLTLNGRRGGSSMAASAVNALTFDG